MLWLATAVALCWTPPTQNVDGSELTDLSGYVVYHGALPRVYTGQQSIPAGLTCADIDVAPGGWYFAMTALDSDGNESAYSNEVFRVSGERPGRVHSRLSWSFEAAAAVAWQCAFPCTYVEATLAVGAEVYVDRSYTFTDVGAYAGRRFVRTANGDKSRSGPLIETTGEVMVAWDNRVPAPAWLASWTGTGEILRTTDTAFRLYRGTGPVQGANAPSHSNLFVVLP